MSAVLTPPTSPPVQAPATCPDCGTRRPRNRWGYRLPQRFPDTLTPEHIEATLAFHPWLRETRLGALAENLRDGLVMGA